MLFCMFKVKILKNFSFTPVIAQALALCGAILVFDYVITPAILDSWAINYTNFLAYSLYSIVLLGIIEGYLRSTAVEQNIIISDESISVEKSSFIPFHWYNRTISVPYSTIDYVVISKEPVDLGKDSKFISTFRKNISVAFFKKTAAVRHEEFYYITILQTLEFEAFKVGLLNFHADISNYNNAVLCGDVAKITESLRQKVNLKFVFN